MITDVKPKQRPLRDTAEWQKNGGRMLIHID